MIPSALFAVLAAPVFALGRGDGVVVDFKDGSSLSGVFISQNKTSVTINTGGARVSWDITTVAAIVPQHNDVQEFLAMVQKSGDDPDLLRKAAVFARSHGLHTYYARLAQQLNIPNDDAPPPPAEDDSNDDQPPPPPAPAVPPPAPEPIAAAPKPVDAGFVPTPDQLTEDYDSGVFAGRIPRYVRQAVRQYPEHPLLNLSPILIQGKGSEVRRVPDGSKTSAVNH
jgi:hypothetical protein